MANDQSEGDTKMSDLHCALSMLVKPADESIKGELHDILELNIRDALTKLQIEDWTALHTLQNIKCSVNSSSSVRWRFVCITLHILLSMKDCLKEQTKVKRSNETKAPPDILSVNQQKTIRTCLQFVVSMGLLPSLLPGVGISLAARCTSAQNLKDEDLLLLEKYERLAGVTRGLLVCCEQQTLRSLVLAHHLGDLMAALSQISFVPLKKPTRNNTSETNKSEEFVMTPELWNRLQHDRSHFKNYYISFIWQAYQPLVIKELLLLHGAAGLKRLQSCSRASPPAWLKKACIQLLIHCLMRPRGVSALVKAICDSSHDTGTDWTKLETVVNLVTTVHTSNPEQYNRNICAQIMEILTQGEKAYTQLQILVAVKCIEVLYKRDPMLITQHVADVLMRPLRSCCFVQDRANSDDAALGEISTDQQVLRETLVLVTEEELAHCIVNMHRVFVECNGNESALPPTLFLNVTPVLFGLYRKIFRSVSHLKAKVEGLLMKFLSNLQADIMDYAFKTYLFGDLTQGMVTMSNKVAFVYGPNGGVQVELKETDEASLSYFHTCEEAGDCLVQLLSSGDKTGEVTTHLFMTLLHVLCDPKEGDEKNCLSDELLELEDCEPKIEGRRARSYVAVKLLSILCDSPFVIERINNDPNYLIDYILYVLERDFNHLPNLDSDVNKGGPIVENLVMVIMTLGVAINNPGSKGKPIDWARFEGIIEPLKMIRDNVANEELQMLASEVYNTIVTRGLMRESTVGQASQTLEESSQDRKRSSKIKKRSEKEKAKTELLPLNDEELDRDVMSYFTDINTYKQAVLDTCDSMIPVHAHGLIELTKLITSGNEDVKTNKKIVFKIFKDDLKHDESYIYLLAIKGLSAMANMYPATVIRVLVEEYVEIRNRQRFDNPVQLRLKIGEVLVQVSKTLDASVTSYSAIMLNAFLNAARDPDPIIRTSSLSNLGSVVKAMGFRIGSMISEILLCVKSIVQSDPDVEVRRAAMLVLTLLLQGLGEDTFKVLSDVLLELYRTLKAVYQKEQDHVVRLHVQLALEELNKSTLEFMFPPQKLEKKLHVLHPPHT